MAEGVHCQIDGPLLERCRRGDERAQRDLFRLTLDDVRRIIFRLAGPQRELEDLIQQVYLALFGAIRRFRGESAFNTFLYAVCLRVTRRQARSSFRWWRLKRRAADAAPVAETPADKPAEERRARAVRRTLDRLAAKHREILVLYEMEELSGREISAALGIPEGTVWTRLHHARRAFRKIWLEENAD